MEEGQTIILIEEELNGPELNFVFVFLDMGDSIDEVEMGIFNGLLLFDPLGAAGDSILKADHFGSDNFILLNLFFLGG